MTGVQELQRRITENNFHIIDHEEALDESIALKSYTSTATFLHQSLEKVPPLPEIPKCVQISKVKPSSLSLSIHVAVMVLNNTLYTVMP